MVTKVAPNRTHEASTKEERARQRRSLGPLRNLTVQPATKIRYDLALKRLLAWMRDCRMLFPSSAEQVDGALCAYLEELWETGESKAHAGDTLAALQNWKPLLRKRLPAAWRLMRAWTARELPHQCPPLTPTLVHALAGLAWQQGLYWLARAVVIGFYGVLRTGELLKLRKSHVTFAADLSTVILHLGFTKTSGQAARQDSVSITLPKLFGVLHAWKHDRRACDALVPVSASSFRRHFTALLSQLQLTAFQFKPYSLRRGGATFHYSRNASWPQLCLLGRWMSERTCRLYVHAAMAVLADARFPETAHMQQLSRLFWSMHPTQFRFATHRGRG